MNTINADTRISTLIKLNPAVVAAIASINPHFKKLENPILRKFLAPRVTIAEAARIGKCDINLFFEKLRPLGFVPENSHTKNETTQDNNIPGEASTVLDVRSDIEKGADPFKTINHQLSLLKEGKTLLLINTFEPVPLIRIFSERGFSFSVKTISPDLVHTYITRNAKETPMVPLEERPTELFVNKRQQYEGRMVRINVKELPMPQPMMTILAELERLREGMALFVEHKRVPKFLLPELKERGYNIVHQETANGVNLIIYKEG